ncbi:MAG: 3-methyl-2-oxobutanoate dehydrogenase subunit VorB [Chloroflexota bacterium]|nr:3-methyl-2-oxobutanoate dehydrogenase subunit VorB [Chloroflexota bacterium]
MERVLVSGNEAVGWGAIYADCRYFFGYPITPQNEIPEFMSRELPRVGGVYLQTEDELASINMVYGASAAGARAMTSTSSLGFSLMQEAISHMATSGAPGVVVDVVRLGPGTGTIQTGQTDYRLATKGGGHGGYRCIVLAPASSQETFDLMQLAFYLADKYGMLVLVLSDFIVGHIIEPVVLRAIDFGPLPEKEWALKGTDQKGGRRDFHMGILIGGIPEFHRLLVEKYQKVTEAEVRYETYHADDARLLLVAYGSSARIAGSAMDMARAQGLPVGLFRPITLWPFPGAALREAASRAGRVLVVEDSQGQLVEDVEPTVRGEASVHFLGVWARHNSGSGGVIHPERVLEEIKELI